MTRFNENSNTLENKLIEHYHCFNTERFYLDEDNIEDGFISIVTSSIEDTCPIKLCKGIAKFIKKNINSTKYNFIYVGAWVFSVDKL